MSERLISLVVRNRQGVMLNSQVRSFTASNTKGSFDILPDHSNFISLIDKAITYTDLQGKKYKFELEKGLLRVGSNQAEIFIGI